MGRIKNAVILHLVFALLLVLPDIAQAPAAGRAKIRRLPGTLKHYPNSLNRWPRHKAFGESPKETLMIHGTSSTIPRQIEINDNITLNRPRRVLVRPGSTSTPITRQRETIRMGGFSDTGKRAGEETIFIGSSRGKSFPSAVATDGPTTELNMETEEISITIPSWKLTDMRNSRTLQEKHIKELLEQLSKGRVSKETPRRTFLIAYDEYLDTQLITKFAGKKDFTAKMVSDPSQVKKNMEILRNRNFSQKIVFFNAAPRSSDALEKMSIEKSQLPQWLKHSKKLSKLMNNPKYQDKLQTEGIRVPKPTIKNFFDELKKGPDGSAVVFYGHGDKKGIWWDTGEGVEILTPELIQEELKKHGKPLPPIVLINCDTIPALVKELLDAGAPLIFTTDQKVPANQGINLLQEITHNVLEKDTDVIDGIFDAIGTMGPHRFGPNVNLFLPKKENSIATKLS